MARARALIGTRFRPQGHDPATGLDCVGLVIAAFGLEAHSHPRDYRLRGAHEDELRAQLGAAFRIVPDSRCRPGDVMLMAVASDQLHLGLKTDLGFLHADAKLGSVVETPGAPAWPILGVYRRRLHSKRSK